MRSVQSDGCMCDRLAAGRPSIEREGIVKDRGLRVGVSHRRSPAVRRVSAGLCAVPDRRGSECGAAFHGTAPVAAVPTALSTASVASRIERSILLFTIHPFKPPAVAVVCFSKRHINIDAKCENGGPREGRMSLDQPTLTHASPKSSFPLHRGQPPFRPY